MGKTGDLFHDGTTETNLGDLSAYLSEAYFVFGGNASNMENQTRVKIMQSANQPLNENVRRAIEMMEADIAHNFKIKHLASSIGVSRSHLTSLFKEAFGMPPHQWLMQKRLEIARTLLMEEPRSITEIALSCGFNSSQHFATAFRSRFGQTPSTFRRERSRPAAAKGA